MRYGYDNCYLKSDPDAGTPTTGTAISHSAKVVDGYANIGTYCPNDLSYTSGDDVEFSVNCYDGRFNAANFSSLHQTSVEGCMHQCASHSGGQDCSGVLFNFDFKDGWDNCYLLNEVGVANKPFNYTFAELVTKDEDQSSGSKAWIAGPVVSAVVVIALVAAVLWWFRRRRSRTNRTLNHSFEETREQEPQPAFEPIHEIDNHEQAHMLDADARRHELRDHKSEATVQHELES